MIREFIAQDCGSLLFLDYEIPASTSSGSSLERTLLLCWRILVTAPDQGKCYTAIAQTPQLAGASCLSFYSQRHSHF